SDHIVSAGADESPGEPHQSFTRVRTLSRAAACGNGDEFSPQGVTNDVAGIKLEGVRFRIHFGQYNGRVERTLPAGRPMCDKMNVGEALRLAGQIRGRTRLIARKHLFLAGWEVLLDALHLDGGFRQLGQVLVGRNRVAEQE